MPASIRIQQTEDTGYFQANVSSIIASRPVSGAKVQITDINDPGRVIEEVETYTSGQTEAVELPAPPVEYSMEPAAEQPYSVYNIRISAPGFETVEVSGAEILSGQTAVQNVSLMPLKDSVGESEELFVIPPHTLYGDYPPKIAESEIKSTQETGNIVLSRVVIPAGVCLPQPSYTSCIPFLVTAICTVNFPCHVIYRRPVYFLAVQPFCCFPGSKTLLVHLFYFFNYFH